VSSAHHVATALIELIENRTLRAGQRLPTERELANRFASARNTVRRALAMLERDRQVVKRGQRSGYFVDMEAAGERLASLVPDARHASPADLLELRLMSEPAIAAMAAVRATHAELDAIQEAASDIACAKTVGEREARDAVFHMALFKATRNPLMVSLCQSINVVREQHEWIDNKRRILSDDRQCEFDRQHFAIVDALRRRHPDDARAAMRHHIECLRRQLLGDLLG